MISNNNSYITNIVQRKLELSKTFFNKLKGEKDVDNIRSLVFSIGFIINSDLCYSFLLDKTEYHQLTSFIAICNIIGCFRNSAVPERIQFVSDESCRYFLLMQRLLSKYALSILRLHIPVITTGEDRREYKEILDYFITQCTLLRLYPELQNKKTCISDAIDRLKKVSQ